MYKMLLPFACKWIASMAERITESNSEVMENKETNGGDKIHKCVLLHCYLVNSFGLHVKV